MSDTNGLDGILPELRRAAASDQVKAAQGAFADAVAGYYAALIERGLSEYLASVFALDYQRAVIEQAHQRRSEP